MTYNPAEPTTRDLVRGLIRDTSGDPGQEILTDVTLDSILASYGVAPDPVTARSTAAYYRAAAEVARRASVAIADRPTGINSPGDGSISWSSRTASLDKLAVSLDAEADRREVIPEDAQPLFGAPVRVRSDFLTGGRRGGGDTAW